MYSTEYILPSAYLPMPKYKMTIAYDGTSYGGWQVQPNSTSIQALIQQALSTVLRAPTQLTGSGRTDAGVHAMGQTAHFTYDGQTSPTFCQTTLLSLNGILPTEIRILAIEPATDDFHARYSATGKTYHYYLHLHPIADPFNRRFAYHVPHPVDLSLLRQAAAHLIGTHDFSAFANEQHLGSAAKNAVRTLTRIDCIDEPSGLRIEFEGEGFLYKMVRNIVGTLLDVSRGKIALEALPAILESKDRKQAGRAAPAHGLFLMQVHY